MVIPLKLEALLFWRFLWKRCKNRVVWLLKALHRSSRECQEETFEALQCFVVTFKDPSWQVVFRCSGEAEERSRRCSVLRAAQETSDTGWYWAGASWTKLSLCFCYDTDGLRCFFCVALTECPETSLVCSLPAAQSLWRPAQTVRQSEDHTLSLFTHHNFCN